MLLYIHVISAALWLGTAATLPFWGNRMNRADHLHTVLTIIDTVFTLKVVFIMGGLLTTLGTGAMLMSQYGYAEVALSALPDWLQAALVLSAIIFVDSWVIFYLLVVGRRGRRSWMRAVPPIGYTNIGLIALVIYLMVVKPGGDVLQSGLIGALAIILLANLVNLLVKYLRRRRLRTMAPKRFVETYFDLLNEEKLTDLLKLFRDDAIFFDPFATAPVEGILAIEQFFQKLGDQFDSIRIEPQDVSGTAEDLVIRWEANGVTRNGVKMYALKGTNNMKRKNGKICRVDIDFDLADLPQIQRVVVRAGPA